MKILANILLSIVIFFFSCFTLYWLVSFTFGMLFALPPFVLTVLNIGAFIFSVWIAYQIGLKDLFKKTENQTPAIQAEGAPVKKSNHFKKIILAGLVVVFVVGFVRYIFFSGGQIYFDKNIVSVEEIANTANQAGYFGGSNYICCELSLEVSDFKQFETINDTGNFSDTALDITTIPGGTRDAVYFGLYKYNPAKKGVGVFLDANKNITKEFPVFDPKFTYEYLMPPTPVGPERVVFGYTAPYTGNKKADKRYIAQISASQDIDIITDDSSRYGRFRVDNWDGYTSALSTRKRPYRLESSVIMSIS